MTRHDLQWLVVAALLVLFYGVVGTMDLEATREARYRGAVIHRELAAARAGRMPLEVPAPAPASLRLQGDF